jgi:hypothetical protein
MRCANSMPASCGAPPMPEIAKLSLPGYALASATSSLTFLTSTSGLTASTCGEYDTITTGVKSLAGLNGSLG